MKRKQSAARSRLFDLSGCHEVMQRLRSGVQFFGQSAFARKMGVTPQTICDVLAGRTAPSGRLLKALGYELRYVRYRRKRFDPRLGENALLKTGALPRTDGRQPRGRTDPLAHPPTATSDSQGSAE